MESLLAIEPETKSRKVFVGDGVHLAISPSGTRTWRLKFRVNGKEQLKSIGRFPDMSIEDAKAIGADLKSIVKQANGSDFDHALSLILARWEIARPPEKRNPAETVEQRVRAIFDLPCDTDTFVYFARALEMDCVKIGFAHDVASRVASIQVAQPYTLEVMATVPGGVRHEGLVHTAFNAERIRGEWFRLSPRLRSFIESL
jgi:hypothetical protein